MIPIAGKYTTARVYADELEPTLLKQLLEMVNHPAFTNPIAIMPDCHAGKGCVIGFTMPMTSKMIPNVVGVDIGCGMLSVKIGKLPDLPQLEIDSRIRQAVPFGMKTHDKQPINMERDFPWNKPNIVGSSLAISLNGQVNHVVDFKVTAPTYNYEWFQNLCKRTKMEEAYAVRSLGTLGGGNHFIEIGRDTKGDHWITIHSGSRNLGLKVCDYWQTKAGKVHKHKLEGEFQVQLEALKKTVERSAIQGEIKALKERLGLANVKSNGMEYLEGEDLVGYLFDMVFAQQYARMNRYTMMAAIIRVLPLDMNAELPDDSEIAIETIHNYIDFTDLVIRKGAIRSNAGERMIIPLNMRDGILLCKGKGDPTWLNSAPHGAGRVMSRTKAKSALNVEEFTKDMEGIFSTSVGKSTLDESPRVYKDGTMIEAAIAPTAEVVDKIVPVHSMKAGDYPEDFRGPLT